MVNWLRPRPGHECKAMLSQGLDDVAPADEDEDDDHGCGNDGDDDDDVDHGEDEDATH